MLLSRKETHSSGGRCSSGNLVMLFRRPNLKPDEKAIYGGYTLTEVMNAPDYSVNEAILVKCGDGVYQATIASNAQSIYRATYSCSHSYAVVHCVHYNGSICFKSAFVDVTCCAMRCISPLRVSRIVSDQRMGTQTNIP